MATVIAGAAKSGKLGPDEFSLVLGGSLFQFWRRARLADDAGNLAHRRAVVMVLLAWMPLLVRSFAEGHTLGRGVDLPVSS